MTFTARDIVQALRGEGFLSAAFENTGGWVMNVCFTPVCQHVVCYSCGTVEGPGIGIDDIVVTW